MTHTLKMNEFRMWNAQCQIVGVFALDEFIMFAMDDRDRHADLGQIARRIIGLRSLHEADRVGKLVELVGCGR